MTCPACRRQYLVVFGLFLLFMLAVVGKVGATHQSRGTLECVRDGFDLCTGHPIGDVGIQSRGIVGSSGKSVNYGPDCDLAELLAASREWANVLILYDRMSDLIGRRLVPETEVALAPLYRWFRAVEACR